MKKIELANLKNEEKFLRKTIDLWSSDLSLISLLKKTEKDFMEIYYKNRIIDNDLLWKYYRNGISKKNPRHFSSPSMQWEKSVLSVYSYCEIQLNLNLKMQNHMHMQMDK